MDLLQRFLQYIKIDTQSQHDVEAFPSTEKQKDLSKVLYAELKNLGASDLTLTEDGYVYATIPANTKSNYNLGFIAHVDTADAVSGKNVNAQIHKNYNGEDIKLSDNYSLCVSEFPELKNHIGKTLITTDGTTLLGADDRAGVAVIMQMAETLLTNKDILHGTIKIAFTPDEEVGRGTYNFDVEKFGANGAYTIDGGEIGELQYENFNAAAVDVVITGKSVHPGTAKGKMLNALLVAGELQSLLPVFSNPMYTENYEGFYHLDKLNGTVDSAKMSYIIRDHDKTKFTQKKEFFERAVDFLNAKYGVGTIKCDIRDSYYNMKENVLPHFHLIENAKVAMEKADVSPLIVPIRGGTDGASLSYKGLPCPNIFTGGYNFHGRYEYIPVEDMEKSLDVVLNIIDIYKDFSI